MSKYSGLERGFAKALGRFPFLKAIIKNSYSRLVFLVSKKSFKCKSEYPVSMFSMDGMESFFGYYDKSPENGKGWTIACAASSSTSALPSLEAKVSLLVFNADREVVLTHEIAAYNWQQACRAHWLTDELIIYNDFHPLKQRYISCVLSVEQGKIVRSFDYPVQDSFKTDYFLSINYRRLMTLRPDYGYRNLSNLTEYELKKGLEQDGVWKVDYETGEADLLISIAEVCQYQPNRDFERGFHKLNHVMISPSGQQFIFMHRCLVGGRRFDRLFLAKLETGDLKLLVDYSMVSHCFWIDEDTVLGYLRGPGGIDAYWVIDTHSGGFSRLPGSPLASYGDGHPHVYDDWFVTDTYPDKARMQHLLLCNWRTGEVRKIGEFFHGFEFSGENRCDLHPRFSPDGKAIYFDSVFSGRRQLYRMELSD